jgi:hypothetical protein
MFVTRDHVCRQSPNAARTCSFVKYRTTMSVKVPIANDNLLFGILSFAIMCLYYELKGIKTCGAWFAVSCIHRVDFVIDYRVDRQFHSFIQLSSSFSR